MLFKIRMPDRRLMKSLLLAALLMMPLAACGMENFSDVRSALGAQYTCPVLVTYPTTYQDTASKELASIQASKPNISQMIEDYRKLRLACRSIK